MRANGIKEMDVQDREEVWRSDSTGYPLRTCLLAADVYPATVTGRMIAAACSARLSELKLYICKADLHERFWPISLIDTMTGIMGLQSIYMITILLACNLTIHR